MKCKEFPFQKKYFDDKLSFAMCEGLNFRKIKANEWLALDRVVSIFGWGQITKAGFEGVVQTSRILDKRVFYSLGFRVLYSIDSFDCFLAYRLGSVDKKSFASKSFWGFDHNDLVFHPDQVYLYLGRQQALKLKKGTLLNKHEKRVLKNLEP